MADERARGTRRRADASRRDGCHSAQVPRPTHGVDGEVRRYEPPRKFAIESTSGPVQFHVHQTYESEGAGARINIVMEGEPGGFFKLAEPLVQRAIKREMEANFATLKDILEARSS